MRVSFWFPFQTNFQRVPTKTDTLIYKVLKVLNVIHATLSGRSLLASSRDAAISLMRRPTHLRWGTTSEQKVVRPCEGFGKAVCFSKV